MKRRPSLAGLAELAAKSLVKVEVGGTEARYTFLETIRAYAAERLAAGAKRARSVSDTPGIT